MRRQWKRCAENTVSSCARRNLLLMLCRLKALKTRRRLLPSRLSTAQSPSPNVKRRCALLNLRQAPRRFVFLYSGPFVIAYFCSTDPCPGCLRESRNDRDLPARHSLRRGPLCEHHSVHHSQEIFEDARFVRELFCLVRFSCA